MAALADGPSRPPAPRRLSAPALGNPTARVGSGSYRNSTGRRSVATQAQPRAARKPFDIEVYENEVRSFVGGQWSPSPTPWTRKDGVPCAERDEFVLPPHHEWCGNWKVDFSDCANGGGERDRDGWEYATSSKKLGPNRVARNQTLKDLARRRRWVRPMVRSADAEQITGEHLANVQVGLEKLAKAREEVAKMGRRVGTPKDSQSMRETVDQYIRKVKDAQQAVREHLTSLESADGAAVGGSASEQRQQRMMQSKVQKLSRELDRESTKFETLASELARSMRNTPLPGADGSGGGGGYRNGDSVVSDASAEEPNPRFANRAFSQTVQSGEGAFVAKMGTGGGQEDGAYLSRQEHDSLILAKLKDIDGQTVDEAILREREAQVLAVHESVVVLNSLFKDMANLTQQQQEGIDAIEANVTAASNKTKDALADLEIAADHQKKSCAVS